MKLKLTFILAVLCSLMSAGCMNHSSISTNLPLYHSVKIREAVLSAEYLIDDGENERVKLHNGTFEKAIVPGSASKIRATLGSTSSIADINNDNIEDAVVNYGGSGTFSYLALLLNEVDNMNNVDTVFLGDRIIVKSIRISTNFITVTLLKRKKSEPMSTPPSIEKKLKFELQENQLIKLK